MSLTELCSIRYSAAFSSASPPITNHDGLLVSKEQLEAVDEVCSIEGISTDANFRIHRVCPRSREKSRRWGSLIWRAHPPRPARECGRAWCRSCRRRGQWSWGRRSRKAFSKPRSLFPQFPESQLIISVLFFTTSIFRLTFSPLMVAPAWMNQPSSSCLLYFVLLNQFPPRPQLAPASCFWASVSCAVCCAVRSQIRMKPFIQVFSDMRFRPLKEE